MKRSIAIICFMLATSPVALGREIGTAAGNKPAAQTQDHAERWAAIAKSKWCCRFKSLTNASYSRTLNTYGAVAVSACWSAGLALLPAIKNVSVSKGAC